MKRMLWFRAIQSTVLWVVCRVYLIALVFPQIWPYSIPSLSPEILIQWVWVWHRVETTIFHTIPMWFLLSQEFRKHTALWDSCSIGRHFSKHDPEPVVSASPGNVLEMHILGSHSRPLNQKLCMWAQWLSSSWLGIHGTRPFSKLFLTLLSGNYLFLFKHLVFGEKYKQMLASSWASACVFFTGGTVFFQRTG